MESGCNFIVVRCAWGGCDSLAVDPVKTLDVGCEVFDDACWRSPSKDSPCRKRYEAALAIAASTCEKKPEAVERSSTAMLTRFDRWLHFCEAHRPPSKLLAALRTGHRYDGRLWLGPYPGPYFRDEAKIRLYAERWEALKEGWEREGRMSVFDARRAKEEDVNEGLEGGLSLVRGFNASEYHAVF